MIEHVRRRALLSDVVSDVYVATCDQEISEVVKSYGGQVIMTANSHTNGTSRVAEAVETIDCSHVIVLQGDEPLVLPNHLKQVVDTIVTNSTTDAWNTTGPIERVDELDRQSFVKCVVNRSGKILLCFRRTPCYSEFDTQIMFVRKVLGVIAYRKIFLQQLSISPPSLFEKAELIEQMRIIEIGADFRSIPVDPSLPSINEPHELDIVLKYIEQNQYQADLLQKILKWDVELGD